MVSHRTLNPVIRVRSPVEPIKNRVFLNTGFLFSHSFPVCVFFARLKGFQILIGNAVDKYLIR